MLQMLVQCYNFNAEIFCPKMGIVNRRGFRQAQWRCKVYWPQTYFGYEICDQAFFPPNRAGWAAANTAGILNEKAFLSGDSPSEFKFCY